MRKLQLGPLLLLVVGFIIFYAALYERGAIQSSAENKFNQKLINAVSEARKEVFIHDLTDFAWKRVCKISVYDIGHISQNDDVDSKSINSVIERLQWVGSESHWGLVFMNGPENITPIRLDRQVVDDPAGQTLLEIEENETGGIGKFRCLKSREAKLKFFKFNSRTYASFTR